MRYKTYGKGERIEKFPEIKSEMSKFKWNEKRAYDKTERAKKKTQRDLECSTIELAWADTKSM